MATTRRALSGGAPIVATAAADEHGPDLECEDRRKSLGPLASSAGKCRFACAGEIIRKPSRLSRASIRFSLHRSGQHRPSQPGLVGTLIADLNAWAQEFDDGLDWEDPAGTVVDERTAAEFEARGAEVADRLAAELGDAARGAIRLSGQRIVIKSNAQRDVWLGHDGKRTANAYESFDPDYPARCMQATQNVIAQLQEHTKRPLFACKAGFRGAGWRKEIGCKPLISLGPNGGRDRD